MVIHAVLEPGEFGQLGIRFESLVFPFLDVPFQRRNAVLNLFAPLLQSRERLSAVNFQRLFKPLNLNIQLDDFRMGGPHENGKLIAFELEHLDAFLGRGKRHLGHHRLGKW